MIKTFSPCAAAVTAALMPDAPDAITRTSHSYASWAAMFDILLLTGAPAALRRDSDDLVGLDQECGNFRDEFSRMRHQGFARIGRKSGIERVHVLEPKLDDAVDRQFFVFRGFAPPMRPIEDEVLGVGRYLRQPLHQHRMNVEPLFLEFLGTNVCAPLQSRHALDERDTWRLRDDHMLDCGDELEFADETRFILAELFDLLFGREC